MSQSTATFQVDTALPAILAAESFYQESLRQLAAWVCTDKSRSECFVVDTTEHLLAGLEALTLVSNTAGESVQAHNSMCERVHNETARASQFEKKRDRFAGTAPYIAKLFDQLALRLAGLGSSTLHSAPNSSARLC